jgi:hypothetical protein
MQSVGWVKQLALDKKPDSLAWQDHVSLSKCSRNSFRPYRARPCDR